MANLLNSAYDFSQIIIYFSPIRSGLRVRGRYVFWSQPVHCNRYNRLQPVTAGYNQLQYLKLAIHHCHPPSDIGRHWPKSNRFRPTSASDSNGFSSRIILSIINPNLSDPDDVQYSKKLRFASHVEDLECKFSIDGYLNVPDVGV